MFEGILSNCLISGTFCRSRETSRWHLKEFIRSFCLILLLIIEYFLKTIETIVDYNGESSVLFLSLSTKFSLTCLHFAVLNCCHKASSLSGRSSKVSGGHCRERCLSELEAVTTLERQCPNEPSCSAKLLTVNKTSAIARLEDACGQPLTVAENVSLFQFL